MKRRRGVRGFTLIELMIVMPVAALLIAINAVWIHKTLQYASTTKQRQQHHMNLRRLARQLRHDVRQCSSMSMVEKSQLLLKYPQSKTVIYSIKESEVGVETQKSGDTISRDRFHLRPDSDVHWVADEMPDWISLTVGRPSGAGSIDDADDWPVDLHIRVRANRWKSDGMDAPTPPDSAKENR